MPGGPGSIEENALHISSSDHTRLPSTLYSSNLEPPIQSYEAPEDMTVSEFHDEDVQSLIEPAISPVATRLKSANTPAVEKAAAMEEGGGFFDSDVETPPATGENEHRIDLGEESVYEPPTSARDLGEAEPSKVRGSGKDGLYVEKLPYRLETPTVPSPWHAGPKAPDVQQNPSSLAGVFSGARTRSRSASTEALKKFLPSLPSMAQVGNLFGSSNSQRPSSRDASPTNESRYTRFARSATMSVSGSHSPPGKSNTKPHASGSIIAARPQISPRPSSTVAQRPKAIRRSTSNDSLLYHSLSRASSLGDDTRFESQHDQVNSRVKAIRDSLQDRSSFKMPQLPSMPSMPSIPSMPRVSSFSFNKSFLTANNVPARWRPETDMLPGILPGTIAKKKPSAAITHPTVASRMVGAAVSQPEAAIDTARPSGDGFSALDRALETLTGDVVMMGGYRGSILRSAKTHRQVWVPVKVGLNIRKVDLEVGLDPEDEERMEEKIYPSGMLQNIGPVDIAKRLFKRLNECENARNGKLRVWDYGYDWRLSPHLLSKRLKKFLEGLPSNQSSKDDSNKGNSGALVIAHSLGGLITRHVVNERPELFSGVIYAGVPQSCVNILGPIRNGDAVLLSSRVLTAQVNFTLRTSFVLLPEDGSCFVDINTKEKYPVDFFSLDDWIKYRFSPCTDPPLPPRNQQSSGLGSLLNMSNSLLSFPIPGKKSISGVSSPSSPSFPATGSEDNRSHSPPTKTTRAADVLHNLGGNDRTLAPQMGSNTNPVNKGQSTSQSVSTAVTLPRDKAIAYLKRTLAETLKFKKECHYKPELGETNRYPPLALIYGKSIPTCNGAKVDGKEGIPCSDVYDNLSFASGDGVCLAKEAMLPPGYKVAYGGRVNSDRGHVTLLGDLNAVGKAMEAVMKGRAKGIGLGMVETGDA
ncbi:Uncharacterized protein LOCC1_G007462 [Lachnellula occidentalis]|uniref:Uncharacterized protein n=1 Tax=Lachnellula occidentalis TaxID=215460 RepID=A0A8H8U6E9_9HELO|nr:Uncharacterized protein LOCC1_G007462 [Lachnellula occidentalis]